MCCSPTTRALKAQRKTERYNRKIERYNRRHGFYDDSTNIVPATNVVLVQSPAIEARENVRDVTGPPSYHAVMEAGRDTSVGMMGDEGYGGFVAGRERCCGAGRCGRRGGCGGRKRGGLVAMLVRLAKEEYAAYKESKAVDEAGGAGGQLVRSEKS